jgi:hypothetical protein
MDPHVELVNPAGYAMAASEVLRDAWTPPCLHYSTDYVAWQLSFPGIMPPRLAMAFSRERPVGCIGVTPRTFIHGGDTVAGYVLSFVAVDPAVRGLGVAARLYETLLRGLPVDIPVIAFAQPGTPGEHLLLRAFKASPHHQLRECRAVGYAPSGTRGQGDNSYVAERGRPGDFHVFSDGVSPVLWNAPSDLQARHYSRDPRTREFVVIRHINGEPVATAMAVAAEMTTAEGQQTVAMLENLSMREASPNLLQMALGTAADFLGSATVVAPNLSCVPGEVTKGARARSLPSIFNAHVFRWTGRSVPTATNLEVI